MAVVLILMGVLVSVFGYKFFKILYFAMNASEPPTREVVVENILDLDAIPGAVAILIGTFLYQLARPLYYAGKIPGPPNRNILLGNVDTVKDTPERVFKMLKELAIRYFPIYVIRVLTLSSVCILSPEDAEVILSNPVHMTKSKAYDLLHDWLKTGLLTSTGEKWQTRRRILTPAFHFGILQEYIKVFNEETEELVKSLEDECNKPYTEINDHIIQYTLKSIAETSMGSRLTFKTEEEKSYKQAVFELGEILFYRFFHPWFGFKATFWAHPLFYKQWRLLNTLHKFTSELITKREKTFSEIELPKTEHDVYVGKRRLAMLDLMLLAKQNHAIDDAGIREEVDTFMFEGHDTTATALGFIFMLLANHREVQERIHEELLAVLGDLTKKPSYNDYQEMKYLERVLKECLRLYPSVFFVSRKLGDDVQTPSGYLLANGLTIFILIYDIHHNPDIYPDPEKFDPDRFLPENCQNRHPYAYLPFSAGLRNCIGQKFAMLELKAAVWGVISNYILEPIDTQESVVLLTDMVLRTKDNIKVKFVARPKNV